LFLGLYFFEWWCQNFYNGFVAGVGFDTTEGDLLWGLTCGLLVFVDTFVVVFLLSLALRALSKR
jgi:hypothetical protein